MAPPTPTGVGPAASVDPTATATTPDLRSAPLPANVDRRALMDSIQAGAASTDYRSKAPSWVLADGPKLFTGYMTHLIDSGRPEDEAKIVSIMKATDIRDALTRYNTLLTRLKAEGERGNRPTTIQDLQLEERKLEARIEGAEKSREEIGNRRSGATQGGENSSYNDNRDNADYRNATKRIERMYRQLGNIKAKIVELDGRSYEAVPDSRIASRQRDLFGRYENAGMFDRTLIPNENTDMGEAMRMQESSLYRLNQWPEEKRQEYYAEQRRIAEETAKAEKASRQAESLKQNADSLVAEMESNPSHVQKSAREYYMKAIHGEETGPWADALRDAYNRRHGGVTVASKVPFLGSEVRPAAARSLMSLVEANPETLSGGSPYQNVDSTDVINLLTYYGLGRGGSRAAGVAQREVPVGADTSHFHQIRIQGLHRMIEEAATVAVLEGNPNKFNAVKNFVNDPYVFRHLQADLGVTREQLNRFLEQGVNNIPGVGPEATVLMTAIDGSIRGLESQPDTNASWRNTKLQVIDQNMERLKKYADLKYNGDRTDVKGAVFYERLDKMQARVERLSQTAAIATATPPAAVQSVAAQPAVTTPQPVARPAAPPAEPVRDTRPDPIRDVAGLSLQEIDTIFKSYKDAMAIQDTAQRNSQLTPIRTALGGLTTEQRGYLKTILEQRFRNDPKGAEFVAFMDQPITTALNLFNRSRNNLYAAENNLLSPDELEQRRKAMAAHVDQLPNNTKRAVLALVDEAIENKVSRKLDQPRVEALLAMREMLTYGTAA